LRATLPAGADTPGSLPARARAQVVRDVPPDHRERPLRVRSQREGRARGVHGCRRPPLQAAEGRARLRSEPVGAHVADDEPPDEISVGRQRSAGGSSRGAGAPLGPPWAPCSPRGAETRKPRSRTILRACGFPPTPGPPPAALARGPARAAPATRSST